MNIIKGHIAELIGANEILYKERHEICITCKNFQHNIIGEVCGLCGCRLSAKLRVQKELCPAGKWS